MFLGERVGVFAVGEEADADLESLFEEHVDAAHGGFDAGHVAVIEHRDVLGALGDHADLALRERGAGGGHHVLHARLVHGDHVGVALHEIDVLLLVDGVLGKIDAIERVALMVDGVFAGVDILSRVFAVFLEHAAAEADDFAGVVVDGEDDTAAVDVVQLAALGLAGEAQFDEVFFFVAFL